MITSDKDIVDIFVPGLVESEEEFRNRQLGQQEKLIKFAEKIRIPLEVISVGEYSLPLHDTDLQSATKVLHQFVEAPTIIFGDTVLHQERRWFSDRVQKKDKKLRDWFDQNRLRYNNFYGLSLSASPLGQLLDQFPVAKNELERVVSMLPAGQKEFDQLGIENQIELTIDCAQSFKKILNELRKVQSILPVPSVRLS